MPKKGLPQPDARELKLFVDSLDSLVLAKLYAIFVTGNDIPVRIFKCVAEIDDTTWENLRIALIGRRGLIEHGNSNGRRIVFHKYLIDILRKKEAVVEFQTLKQRFFSCYSTELIRDLRTASSNTQITDMLKYELPRLERILEIRASNVDDIAILLGNLQPYAKYAAEMSIFIAKSKVKYKILETPYEAAKRREREEQEKRAIKNRSLQASMTPKKVQHIQVSWKILPPGAPPFDRILTHFQQLQEKNKHIEYDNTRLEKLFTLNPTIIYVGIDEFEGYVVFQFAKTGISVLECPIVGNAIYVLKQDWKYLSKLSKRELLEEHRTSVIRIIHSGEWFTRLKQIVL